MQLVCRVHLKFALFSHVKSSHPPAFLLVVAGFEAGQQAQAVRPAILVGDWIVRIGRVGVQHESARIENVIHAIRSQPRPLEFCFSRLVRTTVPRPNPSSFLL